MRSLRSPPEPRAVFLVMGGAIARADIPGLCERVRVFLQGSGVDLVVCDVGALLDPDAVTVDALARLQLIARRLGSQVRLRHACGELQELLDLMGLQDVVPLCGRLALEPSGEAEKGEEARGVEEESDPGDPTA